VCPRFPDGTIHVAVVDPGVGGVRRPVILEMGNQIYVGPDNGLFGLLLQDFPLTGAWKLTNSRYFGEKASSTFHGRDLFAPAAAHVARGIHPSSLGPAIEDPHHLALPPCSMEPGRLKGEVLWIDHFGNCITNISEDLVRTWAGEDPFCVRVSSHVLDEISPCYESVPQGEVLAVFSSFGNLEIARNQERADQLPGLNPGDPVILEKREGNS